MDTRVEVLERHVRRLKFYTAALSGAFLVLVVAAFTAAGSDDEVVRTKGVIIIDDEGRERILIGAPVPQAGNRVRTDLDRVRDVWAPRYPDPEQYLDFFQEYRHHMHGMLILDEEGFDRVAVGDSVPDPNIGRRIAPATGVVVNDAEGFERTGYGLLDVEGNYRVVLGLDEPGGEGVVLSLHDDGPRGLTIREGQDLMFLGRAPEGSYATPVGDLEGLVIRDQEEVKHIINTAEPADRQSR